MILILRIETLEVESEIEIGKFWKIQYGCHSESSQVRWVNFWYKIDPNLERVVSWKGAGNQNPLKYSMGIYHLIIGFQGHVIQFLYPYNLILELRHLGVERCHFWEILIMASILYSSNFPISASHSLPGTTIFKTESNWCHSWIHWRWKMMNKYSYFIAGHFDRQPPSLLP